MALLTAVVLLRLILEDDDLLATGLSLNLAFDLHTLDNRGANLNVAVVLNEQNVERDSGADLSIDLLDVDLVALTNALLLATSRNNSVHMVPPNIYSPGLGVRLCAL